MEFHLITEDSEVAVIKDLMWIIESDAGGPANVDRSDVLDWLTDSNCSVYVLYDDSDRPRGAAVMYVAEGSSVETAKADDALLDVLLVHKRHRREGFGKWMVDDIKRMYSAGFVVRTDIEDACRFYRREGFRVLSRAMHLLQPGVVGTTFIYQPGKRRAQRKQ